MVPCRVNLLIRQVLLWVYYNLPMSINPHVSMPWLATLHVVAHVRWDGWSISLPLSPIYLVHAILCQKTFHSWTCIIHSRINSNIISPSLSKYQTFQKSWCIYVGKCMHTIEQYLLDHNPLFRHWNSTVSIMNRLQARWSGVQIPVGKRNFLLLQNIQTGHEASSPFYSMGTGVLSRGKVARAKHWPLNSIQYHT